MGSDFVSRRVLLQEDTILDHTRMPILMAMIRLLWWHMKVQEGYAGWFLLWLGQFAGRIRRQESLWRHLDVSGVCDEASVTRFQPQASLTNLRSAIIPIESMACYARRLGRKVTNSRYLQAFRLMQLSKHLRLSVRSDLILSCMFATQRCLVLLSASYHFFFNMTHLLLRRVHSIVEPYSMTVPKFFPHYQTTLNSNSCPPCPRSATIMADSTTLKELPEGIFSLLDTDLYKLTMQCAILKYLPDVREYPYAHALAQSLKQTQRSHTLSPTEPLTCDLPAKPSLGCKSR